MAAQPVWYEIVAGPQVLQGEFITSCPVALPHSLPTAPFSGDEARTVTAVSHVYDVVVMSQSCDLALRKIENVLVSPHWPLSVFEEMDSRFANPNVKENARQGNMPAFHMLSACDLEGFEREIQIVDFRSVFSVPFDLLVQHAQSLEKRLRLVSPYREHLSQAFARFFMRVGLPADIPPFR